MENSEEIGHVYFQIDPSYKEQYEKLIGNLNWEMMLKEIEEVSFDFINIIPFIVKIVDRRTSREMLTNFEIDTYTPEMFFLYAIEGVPRFLMRSENSNLREQTEEELKDIDFGMELSNLLAYNELFTCLEESLGGCPPAISFILVLNQFVARFKLDAAYYSGEEEFLSVHEVALLAGMKEKSVRNIATKDLGATYNKARQMTQIKASTARKWLEGRRKFIPSLLLEADASKNKFVEIHEEFFG